MINTIVKEFRQIPVTIEEMEEFYAVDGKHTPTGRPYVWYMFVMTADGVGSLQETTYADKSIGLSGPGLALKQFRDKRPEAQGAYTDWRILQYGWAIADAVASGSSTLRAEPFLTWMPVDEDLIEYREKLGPPLRVLITGSGFSSQELSYPVFRPDGFRTLVATSERGYERIEREMKSMEEKPDAEFMTFGEERVDLSKMLEALRKKYSVKSLDLQGGRDIAGQFFEAGLVDEYRLTLAPAIAGYLNSEKNPRTGSVKANFGPDDLLTMPLLGLGVSKSHTFLRYGVNYHR